MVRIVDGFEEEKEIKEGKNLIHKLAVSIFGSKRVSNLGSEVYDPIVIYNKYGISRVASITCFGTVVSVNREEDYQDCLKLAEECEKALNKNITLRIEYKLS